MKNDARGLEKINFVYRLKRYFGTVTGSETELCKVPFLAQESGEASYGSIQQEEFRAVSFHDVEYTIPERRPRRYFMESGSCFHYLPTLQNYLLDMET